MARMTDYSPVELKLWTAVFLECRGKPAVLRWRCCRTSLFVNVFGCICRHRSSKANARGLALGRKKHKKLQCFFSAGSLSVLADTFKLSH